MPEKSPANYEVVDADGAAEEVGVVSDFVASYGTSKTKPTEPEQKFKMTEVGLIPEDWGVMLLQKVLARLNLKRHQIPSTRYEPFGVLPVVDQGQEHVVAYTNEVAKAFRCPAGGVIVFGDHTCIVKHVTFDFVVGADGTQVLAGVGDEVVAFRAFQLQHDGIISTGYNRHFKFLAEKRLASPTPTEQQAIAAALSDVDALLEGLGLLIAKKRDIKQAAMQELLTGKRRLPGFTGKWRTKKLGEGATLLSGHHVLAGRCNAEGMGTPYLTGPTDFEGGAINCTRFTTKPTTLCIPGDLLITVKGSGSGKLVVSDGGYCISRQLMAVRVAERWDSAFLYYSILQNSAELRAAASGLIPGLSRQDVLGLELPSPSTKDEQAAIAAVLSDMDAEIAALESRREKTKALKQGMMQELLTGRIRLVEPTGDVC